MWIRCTNDATAHLYDGELMDEPVSFGETGTAQVPKAVGEALVAEYDAIEPTTDNEDD